VLILFKLSKLSASYQNLVTVFSRIIQFRPQAASKGNALPTITDPKYLFAMKNQLLKLILE
jgi:hypothetical protein